MPSPLTLEKINNRLTQDNLHLRNVINSLNRDILKLENERNMLIRSLEIVQSVIRPYTDVPF